MSDEKLDVAALCPVFYQYFLCFDRDDTKMTLRETSEDPGALCRSSVGTFSLAVAGIGLTLSLKGELQARNDDDIHGSCVASQCRL